MGKKLVILAYIVIVALLVMGAAPSCDIACLFGNCPPPPPLPPPYPI